MNHNEQSSGVNKQTHVDAGTSSLATYCIVDKSLAELNKSTQITM
jgi:hypothetical protein